MDVILTYSPSLILLDATSMPTIAEIAAKVSRLWNCCRKTRSGAKTDSALIKKNPLPQCGNAQTSVPWELYSKRHCTWWHSAWKIRMAGTLVFKFQIPSGAFGPICS